ncbi:cell surface spherulin 4-like protein, partial [Mollisia scopiformis]
NSNSPVESEMPPNSTVILPLYIYPLPGAWDRLHTAISSNPTLHFIIILNPHNGPGACPLPDERYSEEIPKLNARANVTTVGYVRVDYYKRSLSDVFRDVEKYAGWVKREGLGIGGIFLDETPNLWEVGKGDYLDAVGEYVKSSTGLKGERLVIHNPGTVPDPEFADPGPDITTVVEEGFARYKSTLLQERLTKLLRYDRSSCVYMVHSVPERELESVVHELRHRGKYLFVTTLSSNYYCSFGTSWERFIQAMQHQ